MAIRFNHTILPSSDPGATARAVADLLGVGPTRRFGPFHVVDLADEASIDYVHASGPFRGHHVAFLVSEAEFDQIFGRIRAWGVPFWADPYQSRPNEINHLHGGRGVYFEDPDGNQLECITAPYGGWRGGPG